MLAGTYRLDERIGAGGMGEVWRAIDEKLDRVVAVKVMNPALLADPGFVHRFRVEARAMAKIRHPGVVAVYAFDDDASGAFLVMEYIDGGSLTDLLDRDKRLPPARTMDLMAQTADALQAAHERGIVHRDVKPANLLIRRDGTVVLTDFGIARMQEATQLTPTGAVIGTWSYLAPEQVLGKPVTPRSDVYAVGLIAFECLTGRRPFDRGSPAATAMARLNDPPPTLAAGVPPEVCAVLERALAREPAHRWPSAAELAAACRRVTTRGPATLRPAKPVPQAPPPPAPMAALSANVPPPAARKRGTGRRGRSPRPEPGTEPYVQHGVIRHGCAVESVAVGELQGAAVAVTGGHDGKIRIWDLATRQETGSPLSGHNGAVESIAIGLMHSTPIVVSGSDDRTMRTWDLTTGRQIGKPLTGHDGWRVSVALADVSSMPIAISGSGGKVRMRDVATGQQIGNPLVHHRLLRLSMDPGYLAVAVGELHGTSIAVSGGRATLRVWDLAARTSIGHTLPAGRGEVWCVAVGELHGTTIAVSGGASGTLRVWDLATGEPIGSPLTGHKGQINCVAIADLQGTPSAITGSDDRTVRVWDLATGRAAGRPLTGHKGQITCVAVADLDGTATAITGSDDRTLRLWPLT
jgi:serine/threonine-protein kinase